MVQQTRPPVARGATVVLFAVIAMALIAVAGHLALSRVRFLTHAYIAQGVVEATPFGGSHPTIGFVTGAGQRVQYVQGGMIAGFRQGEAVRVLYLPAATNVEAVVDHWGALWGTSMLLAALSLCFAGASAQAFRRRRFS